MCSYAHSCPCLLHEKPFAGINGSGKHVNWSVGNATQGNLLDPGDSPHENAQFLVFCAAVIRGVHKYGPLMRAVIANEAPPAFMSVYLGSQLEELFNQIANGEISYNYSHKGKLEFGVDTLPPLSKDAGDRNRTSPFAFTGNRFEFRAVGSSQSVSGPLIVLNTMLADSLTWIGDLLESELGKEVELNTAILSVLKEVMQKHGAVIFGGDGYSAEWHKMAVEERGLLNLPTTADALPYLKEKYIEELFEKTGVLSPVELESRYEVYSEQYILSIEVEAKLVIDIAKTAIYPAAMRHLADISNTIARLEEMGIKLDPDNLKKVAELTNSMMSKVSKLSAILPKKDFADLKEHMQYCAGTIRPLMEDIREDADALEGEVADDLWPLPTYQEMLFIN